MLNGNTSNSRRRATTVSAVAAAARPMPTMIGLMKWVDRAASR